MATATTTKKRKSTKRPTVKKTLNDLNLTLINTSEELIEGSITTGEKYQKLIAKSIKKSQPIIEKNVDIAFDTLESIKDQVDFGTVRFKKLIGWNDKTIKNFRKNATNRVKTFRKNAEDRIEDIQNDITARVTGETEKAEKVVTSRAKSVTRKTATVANDLKAIDGIGPKMEKVLRAGGIKTIKGLAGSTVAKIEKAIEKSGSSFRAVNAGSWIAQAKKLAK